MKPKLIPPLRAGHPSHCCHADNIHLYCKGTVMYFLYLSSPSRPVKGGTEHLAHLRRRWIYALSTCLLVASGLFSEFQRSATPALSAALPGPVTDAPLPAPGITTKPQVQLHVDDTPLPQSITAGPVAVSAPTHAIAAVNQHFILPLTVDNDISGQNIIAYQFHLTFNPAVLQVTGLATAGTLSSNSSWAVIEHHGTAGQVNVVGYGTTPLVSTGVLLNLLFQVTSTVGAETDLILSDFLFNEGTPAADLHHGHFSARPLRSQSLTLYPGWNLLAIPVVPTATTPAAVLAPLTGNYNLVYAYNAANPANPWQKYNPTGPTFANTLTSINPSKGLWVRVTNAASLPVTGADPATTAIPLATGWNLIAYPVDSPATPIATALAGIAGKYNLVYAYNAANPTSPWQKYNPTGPTFANTLTELKPGIGYWIRATTDTTLTVN